MAKEVLDEREFEFVNVVRVEFEVLERLTTFY